MGILLAGILSLGCAAVDMQCPACGPLEPMETCRACNGNGWVLVKTWMRRPDGKWLFKKRRCLVCNGVKFVPKSRNLRKKNY